MGKKLLFAVALVVLILAVSCSSDASSSLDVKHGSRKIESLNELIPDISVLRSCKVVIPVDATALGITYETETTSRGIGNTGETGRPYWSYGNNGKHKGHVQYEYDGDEAYDDPDSFVDGTIDEGDVIEQEEIPAWLDKLYVLGDFTLVSYVCIDFENLLDSTETTIETTNGVTHYTGSFTFEENGLTQTLTFKYNDVDDFVDITLDITGSETEADQHYTELVRFRVLEKLDTPQNEPSNVTGYDTYGYCNTYFRESFIIDNRTGEIYPVDDLELSVHKGIAYDKEHGPLKFSVDAEGGLQIDSILISTDFKMFDIFTDIYGQYYIFNDTFSERDTSGGFDIMYFTKNGEYIPTQDGRVLHIEFGASGNFTNFYTEGIKSVSFVGEDFSKVAIGENEYVDINYSGYVNSDLASRLNTVNKLFSNKGSMGQKGSYHIFNCIEDGYLYSYYSPNETAAAFFKIDVVTGRIIAREYNDNESIYFVPDARTLLIVSDQLKDQQFNLYAVYPYEDEEYKQHYFDYVISSDGKMTQTPTYEQFKDKYYEAYRYLYTDSMTPQELIEKYGKDYDLGEPDEQGWVPGWFKIDGITGKKILDPEDNTKNTYVYSVWKDGYSDKTFSDMYYHHIYLDDDGNIKSDIDTHTLLSGIAKNSMTLSASSIWDVDFPVKTVSSSGVYRVRKNDETGEYEAVLQSEAVYERYSTVLQSVNKTV